MAPDTPHPEPVRGPNGKFIATPEGAERRAEACRLRAQGLSYQAIADRLGITKASAYETVQIALAEIVREPAEQLLQLEVQRLYLEMERLDAELDRLDALVDPINAVLTRKHVTVSNGKVIYLGDEPLEDDAPVLQAVDRLTRLSEARRSISATRTRTSESLRKLLGLDQPAKVDVSGGVRYEIVGVDPEDLT